MLEPLHADGPHVIREAAVAPDPRGQPQGLSRGRVQGARRDARGTLTFGTAALQPQQGRRTLPPREDPSVDLVVRVPEPARDRIRAPIDAQVPDHVSVSEVRRDLDGENAPVPAIPLGNGKEVGRLGSVVDAGLDEVVGPVRNLEDLFGIHVEVAEGKRVGAIRLLVPSLEDRDDGTARGTQQIRVELGPAGTGHALLRCARHLALDRRRQDPRRRKAGCRKSPCHAMRPPLATSAIDNRGVLRDADRSHSHLLRARSA